MDVRSDPQFTTMQVIDLDIAFPGDLQTYTIKPDDSLKVVDDILVLTFASGGTVEFHLKHAHWIARRHRTLRIPVQDPPHETQCA